LKKINTEKILFAKSLPAVLQRMPKKPNDLSQTVVNEITNILKL
jgi:hypothetical protein